jgi:threonine dehydrogenase-like Zn-dependent dehydrogenase
MKAKVVTVVEKGKVVLRDSEVKEPGPSEIQVRAQTTLVSPGTERAIILSLENTQQTFPQDLGYSTAGFVERVGRDVSAFRVGDRVACFGIPHSSVGNVSQDYCASFDDGISFPQAAFLSLGVICLQGVRKARIELGESALVFGLGPVGQIALQLCKANGAVPTIGVDKATARLEKAKALGADVVVDSSHGAWGKHVREATGGDGPNVVIESTGFPDPIGMSLEAARKFGRVVLLGSTRGLSTVNFYATVHRKALAVLGAHIMGNPVRDSRPGSWTWKDDAGAFLQLLRAGRVSVDPLITDHTPWQRCTEVYERLVQWGTDAMISLIDWGQT